MPRPYLPNSPLGEVVFELRFPGDLVWQERWAGIQSRLRSQFPQLFVPHIAAGDAVALKPLRLMSEDGRELLSFAINSFAFTTKRYKTFADFQARFDEVFAVIRDLYEPPAYTRAGLRYINWLPAELPGQEAKPGQVHPALKLRLEGFSSRQDQLLVDPQVLFHVREDRHTLRVALLPDEALQRNVGALASRLLDFDCYTETPTPPAEVGDVLNKAHEIIDDAFFGVVTDEFLSFLHGGAG